MSTYPRTFIPLHDDLGPAGVSGSDPLPLIAKPLWGHALRTSRRVPHRHPYYEIFVFKGSGVFVSDCERHPIQGYTVALISPGRVHTCELEPDTCGWLIAFPPELLQDNSCADDLSALPFFSFLVSKPLVRVPASHAGEFDAICSTILQEFQTGREFRGTALVNLIQLLLVRCARLFPTGESGESGAPARITQKFLGLLGGPRPASRLVQDYAASLGITSHRLIECVRSSTGRTPGDLIDERVMLEARRLLLHTDRTMAEIAYELDFKDPSHFGHFFKRHAGCTPGEARKRFQRAQSARPLSMAG